MTLTPFPEAAKPMLALIRKHVPRPKVLAPKHVLLGTYHPTTTLYRRAFHSERVGKDWRIRPDMNAFDEWWKENVCADAQAAVDFVWGEPCDVCEGEGQAVYDAKEGLYKPASLMPHRDPVDCPECNWIGEGRG